MSRTDKFSLLEAVRLKIRSGIIQIFGLNPGTLKLDAQGNVYTSNSTGTGDYDPPIPIAEVDGLNDALTAKVAKSLFDAQSILIAKTDNTPEKLTVGDNTVVGKLAGGDIEALSTSELSGLITTELSTDTTPQLGGDLDMNGKNINLGAVPTIDGTYSGLIFNATVDTNSVGVGCMLAIGSDGRFDEADADAIANANMIVLALETGTGTKKVMIWGLYCKTSWNWTIGAKLYLSTDLGLITETPPSGTDDVVKPIGNALSADTIFFNPSPMYLIRK